MIASMATLALNSGLWVRRLLIGGSADQGRYPASQVNDGACPEKPVHLSVLYGGWYLLAKSVAVRILSR